MNGKCSFLNCNKPGKALCDACDLPFCWGHLKAYSYVFPTIGDAYIIHLCPDCLTKEKEKNNA